MQLSEPRRSEAISVIRPGLHTTLQDAGRVGYRRYGITAGGAMDIDSLAVANLLVGNPPTLGALECTGVGPVLQFHERVCIAISGGHFAITVDGKRLPMNRPLWIAAGSTLDVGPAEQGYRTYVAVAGGYALEPILGSQSTLTRFRLGGVAGRALRAGDGLSLKHQAKRENTVREGESRAELDVPNWSVGGGFTHPSANIVVRAVAGEQVDWFSAEAQQAFWDGQFVVDAMSDRMGIRLSGQPIAAPSTDMKSEPVVPGSVQIPPAGTPMVLMADCQTTGGYPKIATVIEPDLARFGQARPGTTVRFRMVSLEAAVQARRRHALRMKLLAQQIEAVREDAGAW